jgi:hypothetical protein
MGKMGVGKNMKRKNRSFFTGDELEGQYKGKKTLFVVGDQSFMSIKNVLMNCKYKIEQIYFGAEGQSRITAWKVITEIRQFYKGIITIEVMLDRFYEVPDLIMGDYRYHKVLTTKFGDILFSNISLKVENKHGVFCYHNNIFNDYTNYHKDETVR